MAAEHNSPISTPAPSYHSNLSSRSTSASFNADLERAILEHLTPLPSYYQDGMKGGMAPPPNTPCPIDEKKEDGAVVRERPVRRHSRDEEHEDPWFTIPCTILALIICMALMVGPCIFALYKVTGPH